MTTPDPSNPFVWNEYYFANVTQQPYYKTTRYAVHATSNALAFVIGSLLTGLLSYCILKKTPSSFRPYSKILWLSVGTDTFALLVNLLFQTRLKVVNGVILLHISGPISLLPFSWVSSLAFFQDFPCLIGSPILVFQFYFRYVTMKNRESPSILKTFIYFLFASSPLIPVCILSYFSYTPRVDAIPRIDYAQFWYAETPVPTLVIGSMSSWATKYHIGGINIITFFCYTTALILARMSVRELWRQSARLSQRSKHLQRQFSQILIAQTLASLFTTILPFMVAAFCFLTGLTSMDSMGEIMMTGATWYPALNPLNSLIFIVPYRRYCLNMVCKSAKVDNLAQIGTPHRRNTTDWQSSTGIN